MRANESDCVWTFVCERKKHATATLTPHQARCGPPPFYGLKKSEFPSPIFFPLLSPPPSFLPLPDALRLVMEDKAARKAERKAARKLARAAEAAAPSGAGDEAPPKRKKSTGVQKAFYVECAELACLSTTVRVCCVGRRPISLPSRALGCSSSHAGG